MSEQEKDELRDKLMLYLVLQGISFKDYVGTGKGVNCKICPKQKSDLCGSGRLCITISKIVFGEDGGRGSGSPFIRVGRCIEWIKYV